MQDPQDESTAYDVYELHDLKAPKLSGPLLKLFTTLIEHPVLGYPLRKSILRTSGFHAFRVRASHDHSTVPPVSLPLHFPQPAPPNDVLQLAHIDAFYKTLYPDGEYQPVARPSIRDYHCAYRSGRITPLQVAEIILKQIHLLNSPPHQLNAVIRINKPHLLRDAEASTKRWQSNTPLSVLDGVPFSVKDMIDVVGYSTRCASCFSEDDIAEDADVVKAFRDAGMLMIGKCNQDELGIGVRGYSANTGQIRNPHNADYVPGGSSGGCAVSVATGLCPVSIGTDAGGSIRIPAACNGIWGLKPTFARVSMHGRVLSERNVNDEIASCLHIGPMAGCAEDLALIYHLMAAFAPHRLIPDSSEFARISQTPPASLSKAFSGLRIGICRPWFESASQKGQKAARTALQGLKNAGAVEVSVAIPDLEDIRVALPIGLMQAAIRALTRKGVYGEGKGHGIGYDPRGKLAMGCEFTKDDALRADRVRAKAMAHAVEMFKTIDVLLSPVLGCEVPRIPANLETGLVDVGTDSRLMRFMLYANLTGLPACVIPVSRDEETSIPYGAQVMTKPWDEETLLRVCLWAQKEFDTFLPPPVLCNPLREGVPDETKV